MWRILVAFGMTNLGLKRGLPLILAVAALPAATWAQNLTSRKSLSSFVSTFRLKPTKIDK